MNGSVFSHGACPGSCGLMNSFLGDRDGPVECDHDLLRYYGPARRITAVWNTAPLVAAGNKFAGKDEPSADDSGCGRRGCQVLPTLR